MADYPLDERSEFEGGGVQRNTIFPKGADALTPADKLRLGYITGQETDPNAPPDPWFWQGGDYNSHANDGVEADRRARQANNARLRREEAQRYKESRD
jgi:hypothetical protein